MPVKLILNKDKNEISYTSREKTNNIQFRTIDTKDKLDEIYRKLKNNKHDVMKVRILYDEGLTLYNQYKSLKTRDDGEKDALISNVWGKIKAYVQHLIQSFMQSFKKEESSEEESSSEEEDEDNQNNNVSSSKISYSSKIEYEFDDDDSDDDE